MEVKLDYNKTDIVLKTFYWILPKLKKKSIPAYMHVTRSYSEFQPVLSYYFSKWVNQLSLKSRAFDHCTII